MLTPILKKLRFEKITSELQCQRFRPQALKHLLTFLATRPSAIPKALCVNVPRGDASHGLWRKIGQDRRYRRLHDERHQKEKSEDRQNSRCAEAERRVKFGFLHERDDFLGRQSSSAVEARLAALFANAHDPSNRTQIPTSPRIRTPNTRPKL